MSFFIKRPQVLRHLAHLEKRHYSDEIRDTKFQMFGISKRRFTDALDQKKKFLLRKIAY